ncbi:MAG: hypothetical protein IH590_02635 [Aquamicrobium sp.]|nr:hypothetical protein [Aquamicrobium sp.]
MSSSQQHRSHLTSADMNMIMRVHASVCAKNRIASTSLAAERVAALLVREFRYGLIGEEELLAAFMADGAFRLSIPIQKMDQFIGNTLHRWEIDGETVSH